MNLLERAAALLPPEETDLALEHDLVFALFWAGESGQALERARSIAERSSLAGDRVGQLCGNILVGQLNYYLEPQGATERLAALVEEALPVFQAARDDVALYIGYAALGAVASMRAQMDAWRDAHENALVLAQRAGLIHHRELGRISARYFGTTPATELLAWLDGQEATGMSANYLREYRALALAMLGRFDDARALLAEVRAEVADRGGGIRLATLMGQDQVLVELLAGDHAAAAELGEEACRLFEERGEKSLLSTAAGRLGQALYALDRLEEADAWARRAAELGASDDAMTQMIWRQVRAKVLARRGQLAEGGQLAHEAVAIGEETDMLNFQGDAYADLAEVLVLAGKADEAARALEQAVARYERKGNIASTERVWLRFTEISAAQASRT